MKLQPENRTHLRDAALVLGLVLTALLIVYYGSALVIQASQTFQASVVNNEETLSLEIYTDTGRPKNLLGWGWNTAWQTSWKVNTVTRTQVTPSLTIHVTGSNVQAAAQATYYIKAVKVGDPAKTHKPIDKVSQAVTVNGADLQDSIEKTITQHITDLGLSTTASHTIDYYVYGQITATGSVSGQPLTMTIPETKFDTITYTYEADQVETTIYSDKTSYWDMSGPGPYGSSNLMIVYHEWDTTYMSGALIEWDINSLPNGVTIQTAEIKAYVYSSNGVGHAIYCDRLTATWNEATVTSSPGKTTTNRVQSFCPANLNWQTWDVKNQFITQYNGGAGTYYGVELTRSQPSSSTRSHSYYTEDKAATWKPQLRVVYLDYGASWYPIPPLSVINVPVNLDLVAILAMAIATAVVAKKLLEEKRR